MAKPTRIDQARKRKAAARAPVDGVEGKPVRKRPKRDPQMDFTEREIDDPAMLRALRAAEAGQAAAKAYRDAVKLDKQRAIEEHGGKPGDSLRVGEYVVPITRRAGGGTTIKPWTRTVVGSLKHADA